MISPPDSISGHSSTSSDGFDHPAGMSAESSKLTSYSSMQINGPKSIEEKAQASATLPETTAAEETVYDNGETTPVPGNPHSRVHREFVSVETLRTYHIDHFIDVDPEFVVIPRSVADYEMEFLKRHTEELKKKSVNETPDSHGPSLTSHSGDSPGSLPQASPSQGPLSNDQAQAPVSSSTTVPSAPLTRGPPPGPMMPPIVILPPRVKDADLLLKTNKLPFEKWLDGPTNDNKRGKSVLDVAMKATEVLQQNPVLRSHSEVPSDSDASNVNGGNLEVPVRLAINSECLRTQLNKITNFEIYGDSKVMHPPWKVIVTYEDDIKKRLHELEQKRLQDFETKAAETHGANHIKMEENSDQAQPATESDVQVKPEKKYLDQESDGSSSQECEVCDELAHETKLECLKDTISHLKCFVEFIDNDLKHVFELRRGLNDCTIRDIAFEDLWHLFSPGDLLITSGPPRERQAYKVFYTSGGRPIVRKNKNGLDDGGPPVVRKSANFEKSPFTTHFTIHCYYIDFDKKWLGPTHQIITIPRYEGKRPITGLTMSYSDPCSRHPASAFPIRFLEQPETAIADLIRRGKRHREITPFSHKKYVGPSSVVDPEYLNSEVIIDFEQQNMNLDAIGRFEEIWLNSEEVPEGCTLHEACYDCGDIFNDNVVDKERAVRYKQDQHLLSKRDAGDHDLSDDHYVLMPVAVNAFVLRERCVFGIYVDLVQDLDGDHGESLKELKKQSGFEDLVLPEGHGDLVEALVRTHRSTRKRSDDESKVQVDLIDGKGEGLVILLHGVPGVGKTSTAECVAAYTRRPLYPITCANIGLDPEDVEDHLIGPTGHFRRAQQWNCVVLLDEADVFLAKREARDNDANRNALVSVFLRILEYYPGILILTTNRVGAFDEAVVSRIQLFLYYPPLDEDKTMKVWRVHINRVRASGLINIDYEDEAMIMEFAEEEYAEGRRWNGRQIRNFFQTAISLASYDATKWRQRSIEGGHVDKDSKPEKPRLTTRTLKIVAATSGKFIDYINATVPDGSHQKQQLEEGNRNDSWDDTPKKGLKKR